MADKEAKQPVFAAVREVMSYCFALEDCGAIAAKLIAAADR